MKYLVLILTLLAAQTCNQNGKKTGVALTYYELKMHLVDTLGEVDYCDWDFFPVARPGVEAASASKFFDTINPSSEELYAITEHMVLKDKTHLSDSEKLVLYRQHKALAAFVFDSVPTKYTFKINTKTPNGQEWHYEGQITPTGNITITVKKPFKLRCPICLPYNTLIETPKGNIKVEDLKVGDPVYTGDIKGHRIISAVLTTGKTPVPPNHKMIHIKLKDGREFTASFKHPLANGQMICDLTINETVQDSKVIVKDTISYTGGYTYDILPGGPTGFYYVNGILIGSTLQTNRVVLSSKNF